MAGIVSPLKLAAALLASAAFITSAGVAEAAVAPVQPSCKLQSANNAITRVVHLVFDNTHLSRDNPNVPSDIEQMPALLSFLQAHGTVMSNHHTGLISHTATGVLSSITGLYGDRMGVPISNSFNVYLASGKDTFPSAFTYWTAKVLDSTQNDKTPNMINELGVTAAAPWVAYTRAGCDFGAYSMANVEFENVNTNPTGDIVTVFGANSPEFAETAANWTLATADFEGIAVHCAIGSALCSSANAKSDLLPNEAGGYKGYKALFGNKYVAPAISPNGPVLDLNGAPIRDASGNNGFPGFSGPVASTLGYVAQMLEAGIPITYAYITDSHDNPAGGTFGPGEAGYVAQLANNNAAFAAFFARLAADHIDQSNTLFVVTADEGDHFVGTPTPLPAGCDGVNTPCIYNHGTNDGHGNLVVPPPGGTNIGEISANLSALVVAQKNDATAFDYHFDDAPTVLVLGTPGAGTPGPNNPTVMPVIPGQTDPKVRQLERDIGSLAAVNPLRGTTDLLTQRMVDHAGMSILHMITKDPLRNPTFVMFANADYFFSSFPSNATVVENSGFAWDHGDFQNEIGQTWLGLAGPGVKVGGAGAIDSATWSDHVDIRPTILALTGLHDSYVHDGRVLVEALDPNALPASLATSSAAYTALSVAFKQINAAFQTLGESTLKISTIALQSGSAQDDTSYATTESFLAELGAQRDDLVAQMKPLLNGAAFKGAPLTNAQVSGLIAQANQLVADAKAVADTTGLADQ